MFAAFGVASPFLPALLHERGLGPSEIGAVLAAGTAIRLITGPVISRLADRLGKHQQTLTVLLAMAAVIAFAYANKVVPEAEGGAARIVAEAQAYREQTILEAKGQTARYNQIYQQYKKAPAVTRERMYLETMERVFGPMDKTIVDSNSASPPVPYIALDPLQPKTGGSAK